MHSSFTRIWPRLSGISRFIHDTRGVSAIEFSILAPVLLLMMFGILEFASIMLVSNIMESATAITSRLGKTGYVTEDSSREETILASVEQKTQGLIDPEALDISSKYYSDFSQIGDAEPSNDTNGNGTIEAGEYTDINGNGQFDADMGLAGYGGAGAIVVYTVSYPWPVMTPLLSNIIGDEDGNYIITARSVVKNEPYDN